MQKPPGGCRDSGLQGLWEEIGSSPTRRSAAVGRGRPRAGRRSVRVAQPPPQCSSCNGPCQAVSGPRRARSGPPTVRQQLTHTVVTIAGDSGCAGRRGFIHTPCMT